MFLEMVGLTCEKAVLTVHTFEEVADIVKCLNLQQDLVAEKWSELKAEGKVITTPELRKKLDALKKKKYEKHSYYANYNDSLPQYPSNDEWAVLQTKKVEWVNTYHDVNIEIIQLLNAEMIAQSKKVPIQTEYTNFLEMVGVTCEKATYNMSSEDVNAIFDCLKTQFKITQEKWARLEAQGKVAATPELEAEVNRLAKETNNKHKAYSDYHNQLPEEISQHEESILHSKHVEYINSINTNQSKIITLFDKALNKNARKSGAGGYGSADDDEVDFNNVFKGYK